MKTFAHPVAELMSDIRQAVLDGTGRLAARGILPMKPLPAFTVTAIHDSSIGDYTTNCALVFSAEDSLDAVLIAEELAKEIDIGGIPVSRCTAKNGYVNFTVNADWYGYALKTLLSRNSDGYSEVRTLNSGVNRLPSSAEADRSAFRITSLPDRIEAMLKSLSDYGFDIQAADAEAADLSCLSSDEEHLLIKHLAFFPELLDDSNVYPRLQSYCGRLSGLYDEFYSKCPVRNTEPKIMTARALLCTAVLKVLKRSLDMLGLSR